jgi:hypothetical protein
MDITIGTLVGAVEFVCISINRSKYTLNPSAYTPPPRSAAVIVRGTMLLPIFDDIPEMLLGFVFLFVKLHAGFMQLLHGVTQRLQLDLEI